MTASSTIEPLASALPDGTQPSPRVQHLIDAARQEFMSHGFEAVSIDGIARVTGVSKETIYRHFPDKEALLRAALAGLLGSFAGEAERISRKAADPDAMLTDYARAILDRAVEGGFLSATWLSIAISRAVPDLAVSIQKDALVRLEPLRLELEHIAAAKGIARPVPAEAAADFGSLAVEGARSLMGWPPPDKAGRLDIARRVAHLFLHGCGARQAVAVPVPPDMAEAYAGAFRQPAERPRHIALLMDVAREHFFANGFQGASLDEIGSMARVGRGTLYRHFGSKAGLFEASMLEAACSLTHNPPPLDERAEPVEALVPFLAAASASLTSPASIALHRTVITESRRDPTLARQVYTQVRLPWTLTLADWLTEKVEQGVLTLSDPDWHSMQLLTLATAGNRPFSANATPDSAARAAMVRRAIATFLGGFTAAL